MEAMKRTILLLAMGVLFVGTVSCIADAGSGLTRVTELVPAHLQHIVIAYTDWQAIKAAIGVPWLTSRASLDVRIAFVRRLTEDHAAASAYGLTRLSVHAEAWGFDTTDLEWEAQITATGIPPTYLLKLRNDFDVETLVGHFSERGFAQTESYGEAIFSRAIDPTLEWTRTTEFAIHNTAILKGERLLILSSSFPVVELLLATRAAELPSFFDDASATRVVEHLAEPCAAYLLLGESTCLRFSPNPLLDLIGTSLGNSALDDLRAWLDSGEPLHRYTALGVGYRAEEDRPAGTIAFAYTSAEDAEHDLEPRRLLAGSGGSSHWEAPIAESYFVIENARVDESAVVFSVWPVRGQPHRLFRMVLYADAPFAACR
jgi:hypothetical protein